MKYKELFTVVLIRATLIAPLNGKMSEINVTNVYTPINLITQIEYKDGYNVESSYRYEDKLLKYLFKDYNPNIIPRGGFNQSLKLYIGLAMIQLINMYEREQVMKTNVWMHMWWNDQKLKWSHIDEYNHIVSIRVPYNKVWTPDIVLFNNALGKYEVSYKTNIVLYQEGNLLWIPPAIYKSTCQMEVKYFPYDVQICEMRFGSWIYNSSELELDYFENMKSVDLNEYVPSGTWEIIDAPAFIEISNETSLKTKVQMVYKIKMKRKPLFYTINLIIPTFLISCLSICVFYLPTDEGEKITLSLSILFAIIVYFLLLTKLLPPTSIVVPLISKYLLFTFIINMLSVLFTCIVISCYYRQPTINSINPWIKVLLIDLISHLVFMKRPNKNITSLNYQYRNIEKRYQTNFNNVQKQIKERRQKMVSFVQSSDVINDSKFTKSRLYKIDEFRLIKQYSNTNSKDVLNQLNIKANNQPIKINYLNNAINSIKFLADLIKERRRFEMARDDWKFLSSVIDRLMLIIFTIVTLVGTFSILFSAPNIQNNK